MAGAVTWSPEALDDIENIATFIARDSELYARIVVSNIVSATELTVNQPKMGRVVPEVGNSRVRERFIYRYRLIYKIEAGGILIVAVIHGARDISDRLAP